VDAFKSPHCGLGALAGIVSRVLPHKSLATHEIKELKPFLSHGAAFQHRQPERRDAMRPRAVIIHSCAAPAAIRRPPPAPPSLPCIAVPAARYCKVRRVCVCARARERERDECTADDSGKLFNLLLSALQVGFIVYNVCRTLLACRKHSSASLIHPFEGHSYPPNSEHGVH
jgi:hypothetical protein